MILNSGHITRTVNSSLCMIAFLLFIVIDKCKDANPPCEAERNCGPKDGCRLCDRGFYYSYVNQKCIGWYLYRKSHDLEYNS